jgi:hypothetical protein
MFISYRRTGGVFALLMFAAVALAATVLTVVVGTTVLVVVVACAAVALVVRAVLPARYKHRAVPPTTPWPEKTFDTVAVKPTASADEDDPPRPGSAQPL